MIPGGNAFAFEVAYFDRFAALEGALDVLHAGGQQTAAAIAEGGGGAAVDDEVAADPGVPEDPALPALELVGRGGETGAEGAALGRRHQRIGGAAVGDDDGGAALRRHAGGADLRGHAAAAGAVARGVLVRLIDRVDLGDEAGGGVDGGIGGVEAVHVGEDDEQIGVDEVRHEGGEAVVLTDAAGEHLVEGDGVVLVHDRDGAAVEQVAQGRAGVEVAEPVAEVAAGKEHLGDDDVVPLEELVPALHEVALADAGERLAAEVGGVGKATEDVPSDGLGATGNDDDLAARFPKPGDLPDETRHRHEIEAIGAGGEQTRAEFGDDAAVAHGSMVAARGDGATSPAAATADRGGRTMPAWPSRAHRGEGWGRHGKG